MNPIQSKNTAAFYVQAVVAFGVTLAGMVAGIFFLPAGGWIRAFLALGLFSVVSASFTLAKCIRDAQESSSMVSRVDQARLERLLADHDLFSDPQLPTK